MAPPLSKVLWTGLPASLRASDNLGPRQGIEQEVSRESLVDLRSAVGEIATGIERLQVALCGPEGIDFSRLAVNTTHRVIGIPGWNSELSAELGVSIKSSSSLKAVYSPDTEFGSRACSASPWD